MSHIKWWTAARHNSVAEYFQNKIHKAQVTEAKKTRMNPREIRGLFSKYMKLLTSIFKKLQIILNKKDQAEGEMKNADYLLLKKQQVTVY